MVTHFVTCFGSDRIDWNLVAPPHTAPRPTDAFLDASVRIFE